MILEKKLEDVLGKTAASLTRERGYICFYMADSTEQAEGDPWEDYEHAKKSTKNAKNITQQNETNMSIQ